MLLKHEGIYIVTERGEQKAKLITGDYKPSGPLNDERNDLMSNVIEVKEFREAKKEFEAFAQGGSSGGLW